MRKFFLPLFVLVLCSFQGCKDGKKYHDESQESIRASAGGALAEALEFQNAMNETFRDPESSPLPDRYRKDFESLEFFAPDSLYRVWARLVKTPEAQPFLMPTTTDRQSKEVRYAVAHFSLNGQPFKLELYRTLEQSEDKEEERLFLPFLDRTNGETTYAGGRYLDLRLPSGDSILIDFNKAYNPYCAYNKKYSCPIVPRINFLETEIRAGVKDFTKP